MIDFYILIQFKKNYLYLQYQFIKYFAHCCFIFSLEFISFSLSAVVIPKHAASCNVLCTLHHLHAACMKCGLVVLHSPTARPVCHFHS